MKQIRYFGRLYYGDDWIELDPDKAIFVMNDDEEPFEYFKRLLPEDAKFLITYNEIKE